MISIILLIAVVALAFKIAPHENKAHTAVHGAGQIGLLAALALFGVDYFTSFYYATGEMMSALHPYGLQHYAYLTAGFIAIGNLVFGALYMYSLGVFNEGGGSYTASMRYLWPTLSLVVAVTLIQDYIFTIVVSALSGVDQLLSVLNAYGAPWLLHFALGALLAAATWYITIRGRGDSSRVTFAMLAVFVMLTFTMAIGLLVANLRGVPPMPASAPIQSASIAQALMHMLTATMKGMVALTGLEAMSNGIQFIIDEDVSLVKWGKKHMPRLNPVWHFYSGKSGIGRFVQTSFLFYGGLTTYLLTFFAIRFNVFDGTLGKTLVGNLSYIGFSQLPGGTVLFWFYQILAVVLLAAASMTAFQDVQATEWRDAAIGEIPAMIVYRDKHGTFTRSVTITFGVAVLLMLLVRGETTAAIPYYGIGVFMPIMVMGLAIRQHIKHHYIGARRKWGMAGASIAAVMAGVVFIGQVAGKWSEGGWVVLISFSCLALLAHVVLLSPVGHRTPGEIVSIVRQKARVQGGMASIVEWQSFKMQEYRYRLLLGISGFLELFGIGQAYAPSPVLLTTDGTLLEHMQPVVHSAGHATAIWTEAALTNGGSATSGSREDRAGQVAANSAHTPAANGIGLGANGDQARWSKNTMAVINQRISRLSRLTPGIGKSQNGTNGRDGGSVTATRDGNNGSALKTNGNGHNGGQIRANGDLQSGGMPPTTSAIGWAEPEGYSRPPLISRHRLVVPINGIHQGTLTAIAYACSMSRDVTAVHVAVDLAAAEQLQREWEVWGEGVRLVILNSPHGMTLEPLLQYVQTLVAARQPRESITVVVPQMAQPRWWRSLWKSQLATLLRISLPVETGVVITDVPYDLA